MYLIIFSPCEAKKLCEAFYGLVYIVLLIKEELPTCRDLNGSGRTARFFAQAEHFRLSTDCVLLADFVNTAGAVRGIDLGLRFRGDRAAAARTYG